MVLIKNFVHYTLEDGSSPTNAPVEKSRSLVLRFPCKNTSICFPYELTVYPGVYQIECWGSIGQKWNSYTYPGLGAYTKGTLFTNKRIKFFIYVGAKGFFNAVRDTYYAYSGYSGGGATDVRLVKGDNWFNMNSLISRIMVAAGGAGAEWTNAYGGNGGTLEGGAGISSTDSKGTSQYEEKCKGATQTNGTECPSRLSGKMTWNSFTGEFGSAGFVEKSNIDYGGFGGGGYYGGTSYAASFAGSGGSSFISGHQGCDSVKDSIPVEHTGHPFHYSGITFTDTEMIAGNETMPLPTGGKGIYDDSRGGAFRITLLMYQNLSCRCSSKQRFSLLSLALLVLCS